MTRNDFLPVSPRKLRDGVLEQLLAAIDQGRYLPGAELPSERELMVQMGVGRPAVREALHALEARGLISIAHGRRARLCEPRAPELAQRIAAAAALVLNRDAAVSDDLADARYWFETTMVRLAAERATAAGIALLKRALADNRRAITSPDAYLATDMALHRAIVALVGNPLFTAVGEALFTWLPRYRVRMVHVEGANLLSHDEHARLVERIAARDPKGAVKAIERHLARSHSLYDRLRPQPSASGSAAPHPVKSVPAHSRREAAQDKRNRSS